MSSSAPLSAWTPGLWPGGGPSRGGAGNLRAQLAEAKRELTACLNCDSARTARGQAEIQRLTAQVAALEARLQVPPSPDAAPASSAIEAPSRGAAEGAGGLDLLA